MGRRSIDSHTLRVLEFDAVRELLAGQASSNLGKAEALRLYPSADAAWVKGRLAETTELKRILERGKRVPMGGIREIRPLLDQVNRKEPVLGPEELLEICGTLQASGVLKKFLGQEELEAVHLRALAEGLGEFDEIVEAVNGCIDSDKTVRDEASEKLRGIRREMERLKEALRQKFAAMLSWPYLRSALENDNFVMRNGRPVLAVKAAYRSRVEGVVLDRSQTGATLYVEPHALATLSNELEDALFAEKKEVARILWELTKQVLDRRGEIEGTVKTLGRLDLTYAKARLSVAYGMTAPEVTGEGPLRLREARHPLLMNLAQRKSRDRHLSDVLAEVVPIDVRLGEEFDLLILTGPNTGGKTVTLKTIGLLALMAQSGMHIPARSDSAAPVYRQIYADIGDEQSLQQSLSTFSAHIAQIVHILGRANAGTLVLLDELGAGTDPTEGAALGTAILDRLRESGARAVATTHLGTLKTYAYTTERAENGSVEFDVETLRPTYRLLIGSPGSSNALAIAKRLGMPKGIIGRAQTLLAKEEQTGRELINKVQSTRAATERRRTEAEALLTEAQQLKTAAEEAMRQADAERDAAAAQADREIDKSLTAVRQMVGSFAAAMRNAPKPWSEKAAELAEQVTAAAASTPLAARHAEFIARVRTGDRVYATKFKEEALVVRIHRKRQTMVLALGKMQAEAPFEQIGELPI